MAWPLRSMPALKAGYSLHRFDHSTAPAHQGTRAMTQPLSCQRAAFSLSPDIHYLNCAYLGPLPRVVQEAGVAGVARKADPSTIAPADFFTESEEARRLFARLINARDSGRVALVPAVSYGVATAVRNTPIA